MWLYVRKVFFCDVSASDISLQNVQIVQSWMLSLPFAVFFKPVRGEGSALVNEYGALDCC